MSPPLIIAASRVTQTIIIRTNSILKPERMLFPFQLLEGCSSASLVFGQNGNLPVYVSVFVALFFILGSFFPSSMCLSHC